MMKRNLCVLILFLLLIIEYSCKAPASSRSPHQQYARKIRESGLDRTSLGRKWMIAADESLARPVQVTIPYSETGYFASEKPGAMGFRFALNRGEKIKINLDERPAGTVRLFVDLFRTSPDNTKPEIIASADTLNNEIEYEVRRSGDYLLRIQPELLVSAEYNLRISAGPSLAFPAQQGKIQSIWGDPRDAGARKHEGVDIFAPRRTPAIAAADGRVSRVNENRLGGKVVWLNVADRDYTLYYAHLDSQLVTDGQRVRIGDTLGLIGNTGNARTTPPHLHFGIYSFGGAIDPFPFVNPLTRNPLPVTVATALVGKAVRTKIITRLLFAPDAKASGITLQKLSLLNVISATTEWYRVLTPDSAVGYLSSSSITSVESAIDRLRLNAEQALFDKPDSLAARKRILSKGEELDLLATYGVFQYVKDKSNNKGWILKADR